MIRNLLTSLKIVDIEDSGNNGIIYKVLDWGRPRALKVMYGFSVPLNVLSEKARVEFNRTKLLRGIEGVPNAYKFYSAFEGSKHFVPFTLKGFNLDATISQIMNNRNAFEFDSKSDLVLGGAFSMSYMSYFSKLPRDVRDLPYSLPNNFFKKLEYIADEMLKRGLSLPPELDFGFDKNLEPIVLDFGNCVSVKDLVDSGTSRTSAVRYIDMKNRSTINKLKVKYSR